MMKIIRLIAKPNGEAVLETEGFQGSACEETIRSLKERLGHVESDERTADFYLSQDQEVQQ